MKKKGILERLKEGPVLGDGGYLLELEKRGWVRAGPFTPEVAPSRPAAPRISGRISGYCRTAPMMLMRPRSMRISRYRKTADSVCARMNLVTCYLDSPIYMTATTARKELAIGV